MDKFNQLILKAKNIAVFSLIALGSIMLLGIAYSYMLSNANDDISKTLITAFSSLLGSVALIVFGKLVEQKINVENEIREKKLPVYERFLKTLFDASFQGGNGSNNERIKKVIDDFSHQLILWGSKELIDVWIDWRRMSETAKKTGNPPTVKEQQEITARLFAGMRKDVGNSNHGILSRDLLGLLWQQDAIQA